jgi:hypothetical protein
MSDKTVKKMAHDGQEVEILGATYDKGKPEAPDNWRKKLADRDRMLNYLKTAERYWFSEEWYGSEKRKTPA